MIPIYREATKQVHSNQVVKFQEMLNSGVNPITLIIGSSVMERFDWFAKKTFPAHVVLLAKGGDKIEHLLWRLNNTPNSDKVTKIIIQIGTNNLTVKNITTEQLSNGCVQVVTLLKNKFPRGKIIFPKLYYRGDVSTDKINKVNDELKRKLGDDFDEKFWDDFLPGNEYDSSKYLDHVHLNKESYDSFYKKMLTVI